MKLTVDDEGHLTCLELFSPNAVFDAEKQPDGSVRLIRSGQAEFPAVKPVRTAEGFVMLPKKLDRRLVAAAIRSDRDAR